MKKINILITIIMILFVNIICVSAVNSGLSCSNNVCYFYENGEKISGFKTIDNKVYFFSRINNQMKYGLQYIDDNYYYFDNNGVMVSGIQKIENDYYYFNEEGKMSNGFVTENNNTYFFSRINNKMKYGLQYIDGNYYYFDSNGVMVKGDYVIDGYPYRFDDNGIMQLGLQQFEEDYYYYENGYIYSGFKTIEGKTYFFSRINYKRKYEWQYIDDKTYYFYPQTGIMATNVALTIDNVDYVFSDDGTISDGLTKENGDYYYYENNEKTSGFRTINDNIYFFSRINNKMKYGLQYIDGNYYYFDNNGVMLSGIQKIENDYYYFNEEGKRTNGFFKTDGKTYFFSRINDKMKYGLQYIDGNYYYFDNSGVMVKGDYVIGGYPYRFDDNGIMQLGLQQFEEDYYYYENGYIYSGFKTIEGKTYFFSRINYKRKYEWQRIDDYFYYFDKTTGVMITGKKNIDDRDYEFRSDGVLKLTGWNTINGSRYYFNAGYMVIGVNEKLVIDVSAHQGSIDWDAVYNSGKIYGVILRIGYWNTEDSKFSEYISAVKKLGIPYGIYLFSYASTTNGANTEANFTNSIISKYNLNPTLGIYYDLEDWYISANNTSNILSANDYDNIAKTYLNSVRSYTGNKYKVKIYANLNFANNRFNTYARNEIDWIAQYNSSCSYTGKYSMWQYTSSATLQGINGYVDMSFLYSN